MTRKFDLTSKKAVSLIFVTAFFFYFTSESILRQFVISQMSAKEISVNSIISRLPEGIREDVKKRITKGRLQDELDAAKTPEQVISASIALASLESEQEMEKTYAMIVDKYPSNPRASTAFLFFFRGNSDLKKISVDEYRAFIGRIPDIERFYAWESGVSKIKNSGGDSTEVLEFLLPLLDYQPKFHDFQRLYVELAEAAFQSENKDVEAKARKMEDVCDKLKSLEQVMIEKEEKKLKLLKVMKQK